MSITAKQQERMEQLDFGSRMTHASPLISVIIPVYNAAEYLAAAVRSVQSQTYRNWELLLVDDGSTDASAQVMRKLATEDKRICCLHTERSSGPAEARNTGVETAINHGAEYLSFCDSDDLYAPEYLQTMVSAAQTHRADITWCNYREYPEGNDPQQTFVDHGFSDNCLLPDESLSRLFLAGAPGLGSSWNKLYRVGFLRDTGVRFNEQRVRAEDWEFNLMLFRRQPRVLTLHAPLYHYIHHGRPSVMGRFRAQDFEGYKRSLRLQREIAEEQNIPESELFSLIYPDFVYNSVCYIAAALHTHQSPALIRQVCEDADLQRALQTPGALSTLTLRQRVYARLLRSGWIRTALFLIKHF